MAFDKIRSDGAYLCTVIKEGYAALSINLYLGYIFDPIPLVEGIGIQEGRLCAMPYALGIPSGGTFGLAIFTWGVQALFSSAIPSFWFKLLCLHQWALMDKMFQAAAVVAAFLILMSFLHCPGQTHYKLLCHVPDSIRVITLSTLFFVSSVLFQVHHQYCRVLNRLGAFQLL